MGTIFQDSPAYDGQGQRTASGETRMWGLFPGSPAYQSPGTGVAVAVVPCSPSAPGSPGAGSGAPPAPSGAVTEDVVIAVRSRGFDCSLRVSPQVIGGFARGVASVLAGRVQRLVEDCGCHEERASASAGVDNAGADPSASSDGDPGLDEAGRDGDPYGGGQTPGETARRWWRG